MSYPDNLRTASDLLRLKEHNPAPIDVWRDAVAAATAGNEKVVERKLDWLRNYLYWILQRKHKTTSMMAELDIGQWSSHGLSIQKILERKYTPRRGDYLDVWRWSVHSAEMGRKSDVDKAIDYLRWYLYAVARGEV